MRTPTGNEVFSGLESEDGNFLYSWAATDSITTSLGLFRGGEEIYVINIGSSTDSIHANYLGNISVRPENTFYNGTYDLSPSGFSDIFTEDFSISYTVNFTSLTITGGIIPEPQTYGLIIGITAIASVAYRQRKIKS
ncbi:hypothetical protein [Rubellicoccus peritrichatus]|uniref:PEP-CTERM protein-sorting domain-containing protein n=1 Tax=Rubellicoccus peritrichatus TaxID=3080537 RepID=A0AAQ3QUA8_9BACT|nr:hypothetical protein [Puniceicoccus sp. CR14]WOO40278.1 hypothetical protein RZN69_16790 [Puniceicoccus sp. CR14]